VFGSRKTSLSPFRLKHKGLPLRFSPALLFIHFCKMCSPYKLKIKDFLCLSDWWTEWQQGGAQDTNKSSKLGAALIKTQGTHLNRSRHFYISNRVRDKDYSLLVQVYCPLKWSLQQQSQQQQKFNGGESHANVIEHTQQHSLPLQAIKNNRVFLWLVSKTLQYKYQIPPHSDYLPWCSDSLVSAIVLTSKDSLSISFGHNVRI